MSGERFTSWLSEDERRALRELARKCECSENLIVRMALRAVLFDKDIPAWITEAAKELAGNSSNTSNADNHVLGAHT